VLGLTGLLVASRTAHADEAPVASLAYSVASGLSCPDEASFRDRVRRRLGRDPFVTDAPTSVRVRFEGRGARVLARVEVAEHASSPGVRTLEQPKSACDSLADAVAAAVATAIDPMGPRPAPIAPTAAPLASAPPAPKEPAAVPVAPVTPVAPVAPAASVLPPPAAAAGEPVRLVLTAHGLGSIGAVPGPALGALVGIGGRYGAFTLYLEGRIEANPSSAAVTARDRLNGVAYGGALVPCGEVAWFEGCVGLRLGALQVTSLDVVRPTLTSSFAAAAVARAVVRVPVGQRVHVRGGVEGGVPLVRTTFSVEGEPVWTAPPLQASLIFGVELRP
jgi:hypothetical protein